MSTTSSSLPDDRSRKRVRKGTKSCWECKRRKIRCQLSLENVSVCAGCLARGTTCLSQEYPEEHDTPSGYQIGERLGRVEFLLEKLVSKMNQYEEEEKAEKGPQTPESMGPNDVLVSQYSTKTSSNESASLLSLFENPSISGKGSTLRSQSAVSSPRVSGSGMCSKPTKIERLRQTLVDLLPSQADTNLICEASDCMLMMYAFTLSKRRRLAKDKENDSTWFGLSNFDTFDLSKQHPTLIARTLLYISLCLQRLPSNFDINVLHLPSSVESRIDRYISTVQTLITSDDDLVASMEGLECLVLQGLFHINAGNPRRSWLTFRRALNIAQLMGLHKKDTPVPGGRMMWFQIVQFDRYFGLLLSLPCGGADDGFEPGENFQNPEMDKDILFSRTLCHITASIIERNANENLQAYAATQEIEESLEQLARNMPASWWVVPASLTGQRTQSAAEAFDRLLNQIWFFQLEAFLHIPFMLRASAERRFEYSKFSCLKASRELIHRYLALRTSENNSFRCQTVDFGALIATVTLLLSLLELPLANESVEVKEQKESDRALVRTVITSMEELSMDGKDAVAKKCVSVIKTLLSADSLAGPNGGHLRLTIPYFGTINIARPPEDPAQQESGLFNSMQTPAVPQGQQQGIPDWQGLHYQSQNQVHAPVISFTSSQFSAHLSHHQIEDWRLQEADTLFFDSLLDTDLEGNWLY